jgi:multidrug efflux pump subunit AcrB
LLSKTAILLTEYAATRRHEGMTIVQAAMSAAKVRLRPILMTALTMIVGMLPLALSSGAGANGNIALSVGVIGGMSVGTIALLFMVPVFFIAFQNLEEKLMPKRDHSLEVK